MGRGNEMKVYELLDYIVDTTNINIIDSDTLEEISCYNGRDSIPEERENLIVAEIYPMQAGTLNVYVWDGNLL